MTILSRTNETLLKIAILVMIMLGMGIFSTLQAQARKNVKYASAAYHQHLDAGRAKSSIEKR